MLDAAAEVIHREAFSRIIGGGCVIVAGLVA